MIQKEGIRNDPIDQIWILDFVFAYSLLSLINGEESQFHWIWEMTSFSWLFHFLLAELTVGYKLCNRISFF